MWMQGGVDDERPPRRRGRRATSCAAPLGMLRPYRRPVVVAARRWSSSGRHHARRPVPRALRHRPRHQGGRRRRPRRARSSATSSSPSSPTSPTASRSLLISRIGESFLRDLRLRVFDHLQRLSMPFYDREKAGRDRVPHDQRRRLAAGARADGPAHVREQRPAPRRLGRRARRRVVEAPAAVPDLRARSSSLASIKFQRDSNAAYLDVRDGIGATLSQLQEGIAGVRVVQAFGREDVEVDALPARQPAPVRRPHALGEDLGLVPAGHRAGRPAHHRDRGRRRRLVGAHGRRSPSAPSRSSCSRSRTCSSRSSSSRSCSTSCSRPARR